MLARRRKKKKVLKSNKLSALLTSFFPLITKFSNLSSFCSCISVTFFSVFFFLLASFLPLLDGVPCETETLYVRFTTRHPCDAQHSFNQLQGLAVTEKGMCCLLTRVTRHWIVLSVRASGCRLFIRFSSFFFILGCHQLFSCFFFRPFPLRLNFTFFDSVLFFFFLKAGVTRGYERAHNTAKHASAIKRWWKSLNDRAATRLQPVFTSASTFCRRLLIWVCVSVSLCLLSPTFSYTVALEMEFQRQNSMFFRRHRYMHSKSKTFFFFLVQ